MLKKALFSLIFLVGFSFPFLSFGQLKKNEPKGKASELLTVKIWVQYTVQRPGKLGIIRIVKVSCDSCKTYTLNSKRISELKRLAANKILRSEGFYEAFEHDSTFVEQVIFLEPKSVILKEKD